MTADNRRSAILRAELFRSPKLTDSPEITCALEMTENNVFIVTDGLPPIGEIVRLRLSFPNAVEPLIVNARVNQVRLASGPGTPSGFVAEFDVDDGERTELADIARRLRRPESGLAPPARDLAVLLVEDNQLIRDMFAYAVGRYFGTRAGRVHLDQAPNANAAWTLLEGKAYDLVIVDHFLPEEDGASFIAKLRRHPTISGTSVVAMSVGGSEVRRATLAAGADIFLHKPIVLKDLFYTLEFLMDASTGRKQGAA